MKNIRIQSVTCSELINLIRFDDRYYSDVMKKIGISVHSVLSLTLVELGKALQNKDILAWIFYNDELAGYFWFEQKPDCIYIASLVIKQSFHGAGLCQYILNLAEEKAKEHHLILCRLKVIPLNGCAVNAYFKQRYRIIEFIPGLSGYNNPDDFRFLMEKNISKNLTTIISSDRVAISCGDHDKLKNAIDQGYIGINFARGKNNFDNKIWFERN